MKEFNDVVQSIPMNLRELFESHIERATQNFHPGLTTLSWNSMNIGQYPFSLFSYSNNKTLSLKCQDVLFHATFRYRCIFEPAAPWNIPVAGFGGPNQRIH